MSEPNVEDILKELRAKHAKLNELTEAQSEAANASMLDAYLIGCSFGFAQGSAEEQKQRNKVLHHALTFRTFVVSLLAIQFAGMMFAVGGNNPTLTFFGTAVILTACFYLTDKFFYFGFPVLISKLESYIAKRRANKHKKDEL